MGLSVSIHWGSFAIGLLGSVIIEPLRSILRLAMSAYGLQMVFRLFNISITVDSTSVPVFGPLIHQVEAYVQSAWTGFLVDSDCWSRFWNGALMFVVLTIVLFTWKTRSWDDEPPRWLRWLLSEDKDSWYTVSKSDAANEEPEEASAGRAVATMVARLLSVVLFAAVCFGALLWVHSALQTTYTFGTVSLVAVGGNSRTDTPGDPVYFTWFWHDYYEFPQDCFGNNSACSFSADGQDCSDYGDYAFAGFAIDFVIIAELFLVAWFLPPLPFGQNEMFTSFLSSLKQLDLMSVCGGFIESVLNKSEGAVGVAFILAVLIGLPFVAGPVLLALGGLAFVIFAFPAIFIGVLSSLVHQVLGLWEPLVGAVFIAAEALAIVVCIYVFSWIAMGPVAIIAGTLYTGLACIPLFGSLMLVFGYALASNKSGKTYPLKAPRLDTRYNRRLKALQVNGGIRGSVYPLGCVQMLVGSTNRVFGQFNRLFLAPFLCVLPAGTLLAAVSESLCDPPFAVGFNEGGILTGVGYFVGVGRLIAEMLLLFTGDQMAVYYVIGSWVLSAFVAAFDLPGVAHFRLVKSIGRTLASDWEPGTPQHAKDVEMYGMA